MYIVPQNGLRMTPGLSSIVFNVTTVPSSAALTVTIFDDYGAVLVVGTCTSGVPLNISIPSPQLWSPQSPHLYNATVAVCVAGVCDTANTYFGLRVVGLGTYSLPAAPMTGPQMGFDRVGDFGHLPY